MKSLEKKKKKKSQGWRAIAKPLPRLMLAHGNWERPVQSRICDQASPGPVPWRKIRCTIGSGSGSGSIVTFGFHISHGVSYCLEFSRSSGKIGCFVPQGQRAQPSRKKAWGTAHSPLRRSIEDLYSLPLLRGVPSSKNLPQAILYLVDGSFWHSTHQEK